MITLLVTSALAGKEMAPVLQVQCDPSTDADRLVEHAVAHARAMGVKGVAFASTSTGGFNLTPPGVVLYDMHGQRLRTVLLNWDCTLVQPSYSGDTRRDDPRPTPVAPPAPTRTPAHALSAACSMGLTEYGTLVAHQTEAGWEVRVAGRGPDGGRSTVVARLDEDLKLLDVRRELEAWTPPPGAMARLAESCLPTEIHPLGGGSSPTTPVPAQ